MTGVGAAPYCVPMTAQRALQATRTTLLVLACALSAVMAAGFDNAGRHNNGKAVLDDFATASALAGLALAIAVIWRWRWPVALNLIACVVPLLLPLDALPALVFLVAVLASQTNRWWLGVCGAATTVAVFYSVWRDTRPLVNDQSLWRTTSLIRNGQTFPWWLVALISVILLGAAVAIGLLLRSRRALRSVQSTSARQENQLAELGQEVSRQAERERIAREVHDAMGHRLSLLSLHAGALELKASGAGTDDPGIAQSARVVREAAAQSIDDLHSLLSVLRQPDSPDAAAAVPTLADLRTLLEESMAAGSIVAATVFVDPAIDPALSAAAYRITQEMLTNARRHAPGSPIRLDLSADPGEGLRIGVANRLPDGAVAPLQPGGGLTGISERAAQFGGQSWAWIDEDEHAFRALAQLPWRASVATDGAVPR